MHSRIFHIIYLIGFTPDLMHVLNCMSMRCLFLHVPEGEWLMISSQIKSNILTLLCHKRLCEWPQEIPREHTQSCTYTFVLWLWIARICLCRSPSFQKQSIPAAETLNSVNNWHPEDECIYKWIFIFIAFCDVWVSICLFYSLGVCILNSDSCWWCSLVSFQWLWCMSSTPHRLSRAG